MSSTAQDVVLHWFPGSPYCQKIIWVLNYKKVDYKTALINRLEPRPLRRPLDGGYRKSPILQIGNHVYCDTKSIIPALEKQFPEPSLHPKLTTNPNVSSEALARGLTIWLDSHLFTTIFSQIPIQTFTADVLKDRSDLVGYQLDSEAMTAAAPFMKAAILSELRVAESILAEKAWVLDTNTPSLVDFSLAMMVFFCKNVVGEDWVQSNLKRLHEHMNRIMSVSSDIMEETRSKITELEAIDILKHHESDALPRDFEVHESVLPIELGQLVAVTPLDTGKVPAIGKLMRSTIDETVISHKNAEFNTTSITHFPTIGFIVVPAKPQAN
ncbi:glutathione S-transferase [Mucor ambiguus]|uniref:Glutathione S-transferase n=1 Tax=Mucor ambiguus TaxID=91626 RepID=A0A0C9N0W1_9FUNG|nr:glutathione S-transferase [Mucor ambiguus]